MIETQAIATCDKCGEKGIVIISGLNLWSAPVPPVGWFNLNLVQRLDGERWDKQLSVNVTLCPTCGKNIATVLGRGKGFKE